MNEMEIKASNCVEEAVEVVETTGSRGAKIVKGSIIALCLGGAAVGIIALIRKRRSKKTDQQIEELKAEGYRVIGPFGTDDDDGIED